MKLTKSQLKEIIREELNEAHTTTFTKDEMGKLHNDGKLEKNGHLYIYKENVTETMAPGVGYSSKEAKTVVEQGIEEYAKILRKAQYQIIKDWMRKAKAGVIDYFDLVRGLSTGDVARAHPYEVNFFRKMLEKDKIIDRFRSYFGGKKGKSRG